MTPPPPKYRVRIFLAVDLAGSTAYKTKQKPSSWIRTFRGFYTKFHALFQQSYVDFCTKNPECKDLEKEEYFPKIWKTIGDEIIFVNRATSQFHIFAYVHAFDKALEAYKEILASSDDTKSLGVKGNAWIASFPTPNQTIRMDLGAIGDVPEELPSEALEEAADERPSEHDFLGPGIDSGFRISKNSTTDFFTISPALAWILCHANTNRSIERHKFRLSFRGVNSLKGVHNGDPYPIVGINTERNPDKKKLLKLQKSMLGVEDTSATTLIEYLETFAKHHEIEMPKLSTTEADTSFIEPPFYTDVFLADFAKLQRELESRDANLDSSMEKETNDIEEGGPVIRDDAPVSKLRRKSDD